MDSTTLTILLFCLLFIGLIGGYVYYVNGLLSERDAGKKSKKPKKKDKQSWNIGDM